MHLKPSRRSNNSFSKAFYFVFVVIAFVLSGCDDVEVHETQGQFVDSPVEGLQYETPSFSGKTNQLGQFNYLPGESVIFSIGSIRFPSVLAGDEITPLSVFAVNNLEDTSVVNMLRLLQTLDEDGNPNNGIVITDQAIAAASGADVDFSSHNFDTQVAFIIKNSGSPYTSLIDRADAVQHFRTALPYRTEDIAGAWALIGLKTPKKGSLNSDDFALNFDKAIVGLDGVISLNPLKNNPSSQTPNFTLLSNFSNIALTKEGHVRGEVTEQGELFDFSYLGSSKDVLIGYRKKSSSQELILSVKVALEYSLRDLEGTWRRFGLQTPNNNNADPAQYAYVVEEHLIDNAGLSNITTIATTNQNPNLIVNNYTFYFDNLKSLPILIASGNAYAMNASKTVMINPVFSEQNNLFSIMVQQAPSYSQDDLTGTWYGGTIATPQNNQNHGQLFDSDIIRFIIDSQGRLKATDILLASTLEVNNFTLLIDNEGNINTSPLVDGTSYWGMDATKTVLVVLTLGNNNEQKLTVLIKQK